MKISTNKSADPAHRPDVPYLAKTPLGFLVIVTKKNYIYLHDGAVCRIGDPNYTIEQLEPIPEGNSITLTQE